MLFELLFRALTLHCRIAPRLRKRNLHLFVEHLEPIKRLNSILRGLGIVEDDERLTPCAKVGLRDNVDDVAKLGKGFAKAFYQLTDLDALFEVLDLYDVMRLES